MVPGPPGWASTRAGGQGPGGVPGVRRGRWLANGLAKLVNKAGYDLGVVSFGLIGRDTARGLLETYSGDRSHAPALLKSFYRDLVLANWGS
jgi:hypothetical protein